MNEPNYVAPELPVKLGYKPLSVAYLPLERRKELIVTGINPVTHQMEVSAPSQLTGQESWPTCSNMLAMGCKNTGPARGLQKLHAKFRSLTMRGEEGQQLVSEAVSYNSMFDDSEEHDVVTEVPPISNGLPPRHSLCSVNSSSDLYYDFGELESPTSPMTEVNFVNPFDDLKRIVDASKAQDESSDTEEQFYDVASTPPSGGFIEPNLYETEQTNGDILVQPSCVEEISEAVIYYENSVPVPASQPTVTIHQFPSTEDENKSDNIKTTKAILDSPFDTLTLFPPQSCVSSDNDDTLTDDESQPRIRRSSSLKSGKTPPGTPGRKKIVRFADALGLDLANVRTFLDDIPNVPKSAYDDLDNAELEQSLQLLSMNVSTPAKPSKTLVPLFAQPGGCPGFLDRVQKNKVCLENAFMTQDMAVRGTIRVLNVDFSKSVYVRYTIDSWKTYVDLQASYVDGSCDGLSDKFSFTLYANLLDIGHKLIFAIRFQCHGQVFWDSNNGNNYVFECLSSHTNPSVTHTSQIEPEIPTGMDSWTRFMY